MPPEDNHSVSPVGEETPVEIPSEPSTEEPQVPEPTLYELPDGRKVDAETLQREWQQNFMPDYTRKSQELAAIRRETAPGTPKDEEPVWKQPDYVPQTYAEIIELAQKAAIEQLKTEQQQQEEGQRQLIAQIDAQIAEIKKIDPKLDENALFLHANKYGFRDLAKAHENYRAIEDAKLTVEQRTLRNVQARKDTPVVGTPGIAPVSTDVSYGEHSKFGSAIEFLKAQK